VDDGDFLWCGCVLLVTLNALTLVVGWVTVKESDMYYSPPKVLFWNKWKKKTGRAAGTG